MTDYSTYAKLYKGGVLVRYSLNDQWGTMAWPPDKAREFAAHIVALADQAERENPRVKKLTEDLEAVDLAVRDMDPYISNWEDIAIHLIRKGYRKYA